MKPFVLRQQLPEEQAEGKGSATADTSSSWQYTVPLTLDACRCPHLQAYLPHVLNLECVRNSATDTWRMSNPVHALHLASHTNPDGTTVAVSEDDCQAPYGDEQRRTIAIHLGGIADSFCPMITSSSKKVYSRRKVQEKAPVKVLPMNTFSTTKTDPQSGGSSNTTNNPVNQTLPVTAPVLVSDITNTLGEEMASKETAMVATDTLTSNDGTPKMPTPVTSDPAYTSNQSLTLSTSQQTVTDEKSTKVTAIDMRKADDKIDAQQSEVTEADGTAQEPPKSQSDIKDDKDTNFEQQSEVTEADESAPQPSDMKQADETAQEASKSRSDEKDDQDKTASQQGDVVQADSAAKDASDVAESIETQILSTGLEKTQSSNERMAETSTATGENPPDKTTSQIMETEIKNQGEATDSCSPKNMASSVSLSRETGTAPSGSSPDKMTSQTMETDPMIPGQANESNPSTATGESPPDKITSHIMVTDAGRAGQAVEPVPSIPSSPDFLLPLSRYQHLRHIEDRILKQRRVLASKRKLKLEQVIKKKSSSVSAKKRRSSGATTRSSALAELGVEFGGGSQGLMIELGTKDQVQWEQDAMRARCKVEEWMEVLRLNRRTFWEAKLKENKPKREADTLASNFGGLSSQFSLEQQCDLSHSKAAWGFNHASSNGGCSFATGDELLQCLECSFIGCAPCSTCPTSQQHIIQHLLQTGHTFAMSCGPRAELFCFRCGDFVYHEVFDQEKERIDISQQLPWMGWKEHAVQRSFDPMQFVTTPEHGVVWRGLIATYPTLVPEEYALSARLSRKRLMMFQGEIEGPSLMWGPKAVDFAAHQRLHQNASWRVGCPIGLYNLGNTCFMSAVIQCLVHCVPLQRHFLRDVGHHHQSCQVLRHSSTRTSKDSNGGAKDVGNAAGSDNKSSSTGSDVCLACEMDILFLRYFGSTIGKDVVGAVREPLVPTTRKKPHETPKPVVTELRGEPLVTSELLSAAWRSGGMDHLAGYEQRDAHEFLQAFLDIMGKHASQHRKRLRMILNTADPLNQKESHRVGSKIDDDMAKCLFEGILRSVLICGECGCKRSLSEPFLNISLPLAKEISATTGVRAGTDKRSAANRLKICVQQCLKHFTAPESLGDPVHCPSCQKKTPTKKQHTFAKLPRVLCLHLKRFDAANNKKIDDFVSFPAYGLDMGQHLPHWCEVMQGASAEDDEEADGAISSPQILYDLFGTVNHNGNLNQGHYVSNVKVNGQWYHCNDAFVCRAGSGDGEKDVLKSDGAYVLFYIRR